MFKNLLFCVKCILFRKNTVQNICGFRKKYYVCVEMLND